MRSRARTVSCGGQRSESAVWKAHWNLLRDPFAAAGSPFVSLPSHDEAVARLVHAIETGDRGATLTAGAGLGKTSVLRHALGEARHPRRRVILLSCPREETLLVAALAERLGERVGREPTRLAAWRALERAIRLAAIEGAQVVIGIDDWERADAGLRRGIEAITSLAPGSDAKITVIQAGRPLPARRRDRDVQGNLKYRDARVADKNANRDLSGAETDGRRLRRRRVHRACDHQAALPFCGGSGADRATGHSLPHGRRHPWPGSHPARAR